MDIISLGLLLIYSASFCVCLSVSVSLSARNAWVTHLGLSYLRERSQTFPGPEPMPWLDWPLWFLVIDTRHMSATVIRELWKKFIAHRSWRVHSTPGVTQWGWGEREGSPRVLPSLGWRVGCLGFLGLLFMGAFKTWEHKSAS